MIRFFAAHPTAANLLMLAALILGAMQLPSIQRETFPDFVSSEVQIRIVYPGATASDVEQAICERVEDAIDGIGFVHEVRSEAREGMAIVDVEMAEGGDFSRFLDDIKREVDAITGLPDEVEDVVVSEKNRTDRVLSVLVSGPLSPSGLKAHCEGIKERMKAYGLSLIDINGFSDYQLRARLDPDALARYGLSAKFVAEVIGAQSLDLPAGVLETGERDLLIRFAEGRKTKEELEALAVLALPNGATVRLGDLGTVVDLFEIPEDKVEVDGRRTGVLQIKKTQQEDTMRVAELARAFLEEERRRHPQVELTVIQDLSVVLEDRLTMLLKNGWMGLLLVFLTLWLFFDLRVSFWVAMGLPVAFLGGLYFVPMAGLTINMLTMVGLLLALGLIMDDAIVIAENIVAHRERGAGAIEAAILGTSEVFPGVVSSFITTVCVLLTLFFVTGEIGKVLRVMPMMLLLVLAVSLIEAFLILPHHLAHAVGGYGRRRAGGLRGLRHRIDAAFEFLRERVYGRTIDAILQWRYVVVGVTLGVFLISLAMVTSGRLKLISFPELEGNTIVARIMLPQGTPLETTEAAVNRLASALERVNEKFSPRQPDGQDLIQNSFVQFGTNTDAFETGPHLATVTVDLLEAETRRGQIVDFIDMWREETGPIPDMIALTFAEPSVAPGGRPIEIRLQGDDLRELDRVTEITRLWFAQFPGAYNLAGDLRPGKPELVLRLDEWARNLGLSASDVAQQVRTAYQGTVVDEVRSGGQSFEIDVRLAAIPGAGNAYLDGFQLTLADGTLVPLTSAVTVAEERSWGRISRIDGRRTVTLRGDTDLQKINTLELMEKFSEDLLPRLRSEYPELSIAIAGEIEESGATLDSMLSALMLGLLGIFALLSLQFRSYVEPFTVMLAIPMALIGVVWGHILMSYPLSLTSLFGFVALAGIVVNDSILLIVFLKESRKRIMAEVGANLEALARATFDAAARAGRQRFRAVVLTSSTTIAGLVPLLFERSLQAQVLVPMVISTVFGLLASTVLILLVIPCIFVILDDLRLIPAPETQDAATHEPVDTIERMNP